METTQKTAWLSVLTNLLLVGIKSVLAALSGSLAIQADAIHSLSDVVSSAVILAGIKISGRPARGFPYGLYKVENLVSLGTAFFILFAGYEILREVFTGHAEILPAQIPVAAAGIGLTIVITGAFARYELKKGREAGSPSLVADARHIWTDMLSSIVILASLLGSAAGWSVDRYAAVVVVIFIGRSAFAVFLDSVRVLLDASLDFDSMSRIREIVLADPQVAEINDLRARNAGRYKFVELDVTLRAKELAKGHRVVERIKQRLRDELEHLDHVQVHYQPPVRDAQTLGVALCADRRTISEHFGEAPFFRLVTARQADGQVTADATLRNPHLEEEKSKGIKVANWLLQHGLDLMIVRRDLTGKGPAFVLDSADVELLATTEADAETALGEALTSFAGCRPLVPTPSSSDRIAVPSTGHSP